MNFHSTTASSRDPNIVTTASKTAGGSGKDNKKNDGGFTQLNKSVVIPTTPAYNVNFDGSAKNNTKVGSRSRASTVSATTTVPYFSTSEAPLEIRLKQMIDQNTMFDMNKFVQGLCFSSSPPSCCDCCWFELLWPAA